VGIADLAEEEVVEEDDEEGEVEELSFFGTSPTIAAEYADYIG
jgi:hypothetical protein